MAERVVVLWRKPVNLYNINIFGCFYFQTHLKKLNSSKKISQYQYQNRNSKYEFNLKSSNPAKIGINFGYTLVYGRLLDRKKSKLQPPSSGGHKLKRPLNFSFFCIYDDDVWLEESIKNKKSKLEPSLSAPPFPTSNHHFHYNKDEGAAFLPFFV